MRPTRTLRPCLLLAALVCGCVEELDTGSEPIVEESADTGLGLAADGHPLADGGTEGPDSIVHPTRGRIDLMISATGPLLPNAGVALTVHGVARDPVDSGEVVLTLPTRALMDHAGGKGLPDLPVKARWDLPPMAKGDTWSGSYTVPGEAEGYYSVMANAYTHGPDGGPWLFDDVLGEAWMFVSETGGQLTRFFEDSLFPEGVHPVAGPAAGWPTGPLHSRPDSNSTNWHPDSVFLAVVYTVSEEQGFKPAVGTAIWGTWEAGYRVVTVPEDGIVAFGCRKLMHGGGDVPDTDLVQGRKKIASWATNKNHCGKLVQVRVLASDYLPWRLLNLAADTLQKHFGHTRGRINWGLRFDGGRSYYKYAPFYEKITLNWRGAASRRFFWVVAHEYGHALHNKALGGMWGTDKCGEEHRFSMFSITSYTCALSEGFADYAGTVGSGIQYYEDCLEYLGTPKAPAGGCQTVSHDRKPEIEAWIAALFVDLIDDNGNYEKNDETHYSGHYVATVFRTCEVKGKFLFFGDWKKRERVSDIAWCLEEAVHKPTHEEVFPGVWVPDGAEHKARRPPDWDPFDIRSTWLKNLN